MASCEEEFDDGLVEREDVELDDWEGVRCRGPYNHVISQSFNLGRC